MSDQLAIGVDVGGTKVLGVVVDRAGSVVGEHRRTTPEGGDELVDAVVETVTALARTEGVDLRTVPIGVGVPGLVTTTGILVSSPHVPGAIRLDVAGRVEERLGRALAVANDATLSCLAEWRRGAAVGRRDVVMVTLGTGIGGGVVAGGQLVTGAHGFTGEFGHMLVDPHGPPCPCGRRGCWERYASGTGLVDLARAAGQDGRLVGGVAGDSGWWDGRGEDVYLAALAGNEDALAVVDEFARWVAVGLANLTNALDPEVFVLGGGLAEGAALYLGPIQRWFGELVYASDRRPWPAVEFARLGERAGAIGAALAGRDLAAGHPLGSVETSSGHDPGDVIAST